MSSGCEIPKEIHNFFRYCSTTGNIYKIAPTGSRSKLGLCSSMNNRGYLHTRFKYKMLLLHRLAWFLYYNEQPPENIDHIDGNKTNNSIINLRAATVSQNHYNIGKRSHNTTGFKGVSYNKNTSKWYARIYSNKIKHHLGYFNTPELAYLAYCEAADKYHGEFTNIT